MLHVSPRWVSQNLSAHDRCQWVASSQELLGSYTCDKELLSSFGYWGQNADLPLSPIKQIRIHAVEERGLPHIYRTDLCSLVSWSKEWQMFFNLDKCKVMHLGFNNPHVDYFMDAIQIQEVHEEKRLGG